MKYYLDIILEYLIPMKYYLDIRAQEALAVIITVTPPVALTC